MALFGMPIYAVYTAAAEVPPPGAGVVTVMLTFPGVATAAAGMLVVSSVELTKSEAMVAPFKATVL